MFTTVHSVLQIVLEKLLLAAGILAKGGILAEGAGALQPWQVLTRRFPELRWLQFVWCYYPYKITCTVHYIASLSF